MKLKSVFAVLVLLVLTAHGADQLLIEAESFAQPGGWKLDTQFIEIMGSPYMLAHGLGRPVDDAATTVQLPSAGKYHVFVRTKDWVALWDAPGAPGRFQLVVNGQKLDHTLGAKGKDWLWEHGGTVTVEQKQVDLTLHDLTGFDGRCDAILFSKDSTPPPKDSGVLSEWRRKRLGLPESPEIKQGYDLAVIGEGYSGVGTALSAARLVW